MTSDKLNKTKAALVYDFDGTLAEGNCADHGLLPEIGITDINDFWRKITKETEDRDADGRKLPQFCTHLIEDLLEVSKWPERRNTTIMMIPSRQPQ